MPTNPYRFEYRFQPQNERQEPYLIDGILAGLIIAGTLVAILWMKLYAP